MFREIFESKLVYIVVFDKPLNKNERKSFNTVNNITINQNKEIETTDKNSYNQILNRADEIGLKYDNFVETLK